ncbi:hypothetical protein BH24ACI3_BH24ACI3_10620 [soil metagenome]
MNEIYRSAKTLSIVTISGLALIGLFEAFSIFIGIGQLASPGTIIDLDDGGDETSLWLMLQGIVILFRAPFYIATIVVFLIWLYRAHSNLYALMPTNLEFSSGWAVGWWFIPFANLVKPFQVVREVWWESDPDIPDAQNFLTASLHSAPTYMVLWWIFWIAGNIASNVAGRVYDPDRIDTVTSSGVAFIIAGFLMVIGAALAIYVVRDITLRQEMRAMAVGQRATAAPPPPPVFAGSDRI